MQKRLVRLPLIVFATTLACGGAEATESPPVNSAPDPGAIMVVRDTMVPDVVAAPAIVEPIVQAMLGTKLLSYVTSVAVREGDVVSAGVVLVRLDARDLAAKREQAEAGVQSANAARDEAALHASRIRALFADSAAPRAQLDASEAGLIRADQAVRAARAMLAEVASLTDYAEVRAPFAGVITQRFVDPGTFVSPGSPLLRIDDPSRLRVTAAVPPPAAASLKKGAPVAVTIEGIEASAIIEGIVPVAGASLVSVSAIVENPSHRFSASSAATLSLGGGTRSALLVPANAILRTGDLTGVRVPTRVGTVTRWVRVGRVHGPLVEVLSGLSSGDSIVLPVAPVRN